MSSYFGFSQGTSPQKFEVRRWLDGNSRLYHEEWCLLSCLGEEGEEKYFPRFVTGAKAFFFHLEKGEGEALQKAFTHSNGLLPVEVNLKKVAVASLSQEPLAFFLEVLLASQLARPSAVAPEVYKTCAAQLRHLLLQQEGDPRLPCLLTHGWGAVVGDLYFLPLALLVRREDLPLIKPQEAEAIMFLRNAMRSYNYPQERPLAAYKTWDGARLAPNGRLADQEWLVLLSTPLGGAKTTYQWGGRAQTLTTSLPAFYKLLEKEKVTLKEYREGESWLRRGPTPEEELQAFRGYLAQGRSNEGAQRAFQVYSKVFSRLGSHASLTLHNQAHSILMAKSASEDYLLLFEEWAEEVTAHSQSPEHLLKLTEALFATCRGKGKGLTGITQERAYKLLRGVVSPLEFITLQTTVLTTPGHRNLTEGELLYYRDHHEELASTPLSWWRTLAQGE